MYFEFTFVKGVSCLLWSSFLFVCFVHMDVQLSQYHLLKDQLSLLNCLLPLLKIGWLHFLGIFVCEPSLFYPLIYTSFSSLMSCYLDYCSLISVEMDNVNPSSLFFSCSLLALPDLVPFHITLRIRLSISTKQIAGTVIEVLLNVGIKSERIDRIISSLAVHWHGISLHWFRSLFSFIRILFFLVFS